MALLPDLPALALPRSGSRVCGSHRTLSAHALPCGTWSCFNWTLSGSWSCTAVRVRGYSPVIATDP